MEKPKEVSSKKSLIGLDGKFAIIGFFIVLLSLILFFTT